MKSFIKRRPVPSPVRPGRIARSAVVLALAALFTGACADATGTQGLSTLTVTPATQTIAVTGTAQLTAVGTRAGIDVTDLRGETWSVSGGGTISSTGLFTAGTVPGTYTATVSCGGLTSNATIIVTAGPLATITVTPDPATLQFGQTQQFTATGADAFGNPVAITPTWTVTAGGGTIDPATGLFTAGTAVGTFTNTVRATSGTISDAATVIVTGGPLARITVTPNPATMQIGAQQQFTAVGTDAAGNVVPMTPTWSVINGGGTIDGTSGLFTAGNTVGTFGNTVRASSGGISGTATVNVTAGALATITVTPNPTTLQTGTNRQFTAVGRDAGGNVVAITPTWSVTNNGGTINATTGLFTAGGTAGTFANTVRATQGSIFGTATVTVTTTPPPPLMTITVTPNPVTLQTGATQQFTAVGRDSNGDIVPIDPTWSVTSGGGTINANTGVFTAGNTAGTFTNTVRATDGAIFGTATVTVTSPPPPAPSSGFTVLANAAVSCTDGSIEGDVGTRQASPTGSIARTNCPITNGTAQVGTAASVQAYNAFVNTFNDLGTVACDQTLTGSLAGQNLAPGVYCFGAAASLTGTLTLQGPANGVWLFKIGTSGTGALTTTNFNVVMAGSSQACNVTWRVQDGATATDSNLKGNILAGAGVTLTRGTLIGNAWSQADVTITGTAVTGC